MVSEKQHAPSRKKLEKARQEGLTARSAAVSKAAALASVFIFSFKLLPLCWVELRMLLEYCSSTPQGGLADCLKRSLWLLGRISGVSLTVIALVAVLVEFSQVGIRFEVSLLTIRSSRLNAFSGMRRILSGIRDSWVQLMFVAILAIGAGVIVAHQLPATISGILAGDRRFFFLVILAQVLIAGVLLHACVDFILKRRRFRRDQSMSTRDVRDECKESEGDPQIRQVRRLLHEELALTELVARVKQARVIVVERG